MEGSMGGSTGRSAVWSREPWYNAYLIWTVAVSMRSEVPVASEK